MELPGEIREEVVKYLDVPSSLSLQETSRRWNRDRMWCGSDHMNKIITAPITPKEVEEVYRNAPPSTPIFVLSVNELQDDDIPGVGIGPMTTIYLRTLDPIEDATRNITIKVSTTGVRYHVAIGPGMKPAGGINKNIIDRFANRKAAFDYRREVSWIDPYTSRLVVRRRLLSCPTKEPSIWEFFPEYRPGDPLYDKIRSVIRDMYLLGTATVNGLYNIYHFKGQYENDDQYGGDTIEYLTEKLKELEA